MTGIECQLVSFTNIQEQSDTQRESAMAESQEQGADDKRRTNVTEVRTWLVLWISLSCSLLCEHVPLGCPPIRDKDPKEYRIKDRAQWSKEYAHTVAWWYQQNLSVMSQEQQAELKSVGEQMWEQIKRVLLRERVEKELAAQMPKQEEEASEHIIAPTKERRSIVDILFPWRGRRTQRRVVVGTAPAPEH